MVEPRSVTSALQIDLGERVGLIGDVHADLEFLAEAVYALDERGATSLVQLGDFGFVWTGGSDEDRALERVNEVLSFVDRELFVVLGNHEGYDRIDAIPPEPDGTRRIGRIVLLPRSGRATAAGRPVGFLAGAGSVDRSTRLQGRAWWSQEIPTNDEAAGLRGDGTLDVVFAHDALRGPALVTRLEPSRTMWASANIEYAEEAADLFTERVLAVLSDGGLVLSGHYHFRHSSEETFARSDGTVVRARSEILAHEFSGESTGLLYTTTLELQTWALDSRRTGKSYAAFKRLLRAHAGLAYELGLSELTVQRLMSGSLPVPPGLLRRVAEIAARDA